MKKKKHRYGCFGVVCSQKAKPKQLLVAGKRAADMLLLVIWFRTSRENINVPVNDKKSPQVLFSSIRHRVTCFPVCQQLNLSEQRPLKPRVHKLRFRYKSSLLCSEVVIRNRKYLEKDATKNGMHKLKASDIILYISSKLLHIREPLTTTGLIRTLAPTDVDLFPLYVVHARLLSCLRR